MSAATVERKVKLRFRDHSEFQHVETPFRENLSAAAQTGNCLWFACDETTTLERLSDMGGELFGDHRHIQLAEYFDLPAGPEEEIDIEGLFVDDGYLWIVGSHGLRRKKPKRDQNDNEKALKRLTKIKSDTNRYFLGRVPLAEGPNGIWDLKAIVEIPDQTIRRVAGCLAMVKGRNSLVDALSGDIHVERFLNIPCKENGLDVEGIATRGDRVFLGLRGPVLRGWATLLEVRIGSPRQGLLELQRIGPSEELFLKHFIDLHGLGIRDLAFDGDELLILAGPTMDISGPIRIYRWSHALSPEDSVVVPHNQVEKLLDIPFGDGEDHAEGMVLITNGNERNKMLVVYDSPSQNRLHEDGTGIDADVFSIPR